MLLSTKQLHWLVYHFIKLSCPGDPTRYGWHVSGNWRIILQLLILLSDVLQISVNVGVRVRSRVGVTFRVRRIVRVRLLRFELEVEWGSELRSELELESGI